MARQTRTALQRATDDRDAAKGRHDRARAKWDRLRPEADAARADVAKTLTELEAYQALVDALSPSPGDAPEPDDPPAGVID